MFKKALFLGLLLSAFAVVPFTGSQVAAATPASSDENLAWFGWGGYRGYYRPYYGYGYGGYGCGCGYGGYGYGYGSGYGYGGYGGYGCGCCY